MYGAGGAFFTNVDNTIEGTGQLGLDLMSIDDQGLITVARVST